MQKTDGTAAATRADLEALWIRIDKRFEQVDKRFEQVDKRFEQVDKRFEQMDLRFEEMDHRFTQQFILVGKRFEDMKLHFEITAENMLGDFNGAFGDRLSQQNDEITHLKKRTGAIERRLRFSRR
ncbi:MAG: hypothetical protein QF793_03145 [Candidatus Peribacteraceae bacterium]|nr:hypothetical protein [Candidatus Peribacteraceae bacterium]